jgi:hypothetical protein
MLAEITHRKSQETINEKVAVITVYKPGLGQVIPYKIRWQGRVYRITKIGFHHKVREGRTLFHIFSVASDTLAFRLKHNTLTLPISEFGLCSCGFLVHPL